MADTIPIPTNPRYQDLSGQVFGRLTVVSLHNRLKNRTRFLCLCRCGNYTIVRSESLKAGTSQSCGCLCVMQKWRDVPPPPTRVCTKCGEEKPLNNKFFYRHPQSIYGFDTQCSKCKQHYNRPKVKAHQDRRRLQALVAYSGASPHCQCQGCSESHVEFLGIDHVEGGGAKHRRAVGSIYQWLFKHNYPPGFRVLCHNCNMALGLYGRCPHNA